MKNRKIYTGLGIFLGIILIFILSLKIFEIVYFNEKYYKIPDLRSYTFKDAEKIIKDSDLNIKDMGTELSSYPVGEIFLQEPKPNTIVKKGRNIKVWVSKGQALVDIPNLNHMNFLEAKVIAEKNGLEIGDIITVKSTGKYNEVLATDPATNTLMPKGTRISFLLNGLENVIQVAMPDLIGIDLDAAREILFKQSLVVGEIKYINIPSIQSGVVVKTSVKSGEKINAGSSIDIVVNN